MSQFLFLSAVLHVHVLPYSLTWRVQISPGILHTAKAQMTSSTAAQSAQGLCDFVNESWSPFHVVASVSKRLLAAGYTEINESEKYEVKLDKWTHMAAMKDKRHYLSACTVNDEFDKKELK